MARKGFYEELQTKRYLTTITPKMYKWVEDVLDGADEEAKERIIKALLPKIIDKSLPTQITGDEGEAIVIKVAKEVAEKYDIDSSTIGNSEGQDKV